MSKHQAMIDYIGRFPPISNKWLYFDYIDDDREKEAISPIVQEITQFDIMGNKIGQYDFAIILTRPYSKATDDVNIQNMDFIDLWIEWLIEQNYDRVLPDFGAKFEVTSVKNLSNMGDLAQTYDSGMGKYMLLCRVEYIEWRK